MISISGSALAGVRRQLILGLVLSASWVNTHAVDLGANFTVGVSYTDNIDRFDEEGRDETIGQVGMGFTLAEETRKLLADIRGTIDYFDYTSGTYDAELVGALDGLVNINIVDDRFEWMIQDNYGRALFDPFLPARPENWENINFFTTGPTLTAFRGARNSAGVDLRYSTLDYEMRPFDNDRQSARIWFGREIRRGKTLSLNLDVEKTEFDNDGLTPDYERRSAYLRYDGETARGLFDVRLGYTEQEILDSTADGITFDVSWTRELTSISRITFNAGRQFADQGNVFRYQQDITRDLDSIGDLTENGSPFTRNSIDVSYELEADRTLLSLRVGGSEEDYEDEMQLQLDRTDIRAEIFVRRDFSRSFFGSIELNFYDRDFPDLDREDETTSAGVSLGYRLTASLDLSVRYGYYNRNSDRPTEEFEENRGDLILRYTPSWGR